MRTCTKCNITKELNEFYTCRGIPQLCCKTCKKEYSKNYKKTLKNPEVKAARLERAKARKERQSRGVKLCCKCNQEKLISDFYIEKVGTPGSKCKNCLQQHNRVWQKNNPEKREIQRKRQKINNPARFLLRAAKSRSIQKGWECNIEKSDIVVPTICPVLGITITHNEDKATSLSIDRIDNSKGYIKGNIIITSCRANELKRNSSIEDLTKIINFYQNIDVWKSKIHELELMEFSCEKYQWHTIQDTEERNRIRRLEHKNNPIVNIVRGARYRAKKRNMEFNLTEKDIKIPKTCPIFDTPLEIAGSNIENSPSIDRIDNDKGYTSDNIIVISYKANRAKGDASIEELIKIRDFYEKLKSPKSEN